MNGVRAAAMVGLLFTSACSSDGSDQEQGVSNSTTTTTIGSSTSTEEDRPTTSAAAPTTTTTTIPALFELDDAVAVGWVQRTGLIDDAGRVLREIANPNSSNVANDGFGGLAWIEDDVLLWLPEGAVEPQMVEVDLEDAPWSIRRSPLSAEPAMFVNNSALIGLETGQRIGDFEGVFRTMTAANGLEARATDPGRLDPDIHIVERVRSLARLQILRGDTVVLDIPLGAGFAENEVRLIDFDGHSIIIGRNVSFIPTHGTYTQVYIDLATGEMNVIGRDGPMPWTLVGPERTDQPAEFTSPDLTDLCPTWTGNINFELDVSLPEPVARRRADLLLALETCDFSYFALLRNHEMPTAAGGPRLELADFDSSVWSTLHELMDGPPTAIDGEFQWSVDHVLVQIDADGLVSQFDVPDG